MARGPSVIVLPFEHVGAESGQDFIARGLTFEIINSLARFSDLLVFGPETSFGICDPDMRATSLRALQPDYVPHGSIYSTDEELRVSAILADARSNRSVWSTNLGRHLSTASRLRAARRPGEAELALAELLRIDADYGDHVADDLAKRGVSPRIIRAVVEGLVKAGLQVPSPPTND